MARPKDPAERARRVAEMERKASMRRGLRWGVVVLAALVVLGGVAYGISRIPPPPKDVHWHAKYQVWVDGQQVSFANSKFDANVQTDFYLPAHMHGPNFDVIHNEGKEGQGTLGKFFAFGLFGGRIADDELVIPEGASLASTGAPFSGDFKVQGNQTLGLYASNQVTNQTWTRVPASYADYSFHEGDRLLVVYGDNSPDAVALLEAQFPDFDPSTVS